MAKLGLNQVESKPNIKVEKRIQAGSQLWQNESKSSLNQVYISPKVGLMQK